MCKISVIEGIDGPSKKDDQLIVLLKAAHRWPRQVGIVQRTSCAHIPVFETVSCKAVIGHLKSLFGKVLVAVSPYQVLLVISVIIKSVVYRIFEGVSPHVLM